jgi:type I restriction enzyme S subunit
MLSKPTKLPLAELLELIIDHRGKTPNKQGFEDFFSAGVPVLSAKHVKTDALVDLSSMRYASPAMYKKWMVVELQEGDIILTSEAPMGEVFYINDDKKYVLGQRVFGLRPNARLINPKYLAAWLASAEGQNQIAARASGSTVQGIRQSELLKLEVGLPSKEEQARIANIRFSIADKVNLNLRINQTLEAMAQAIFKSWFVDFDPVKAKIAAIAGGRDPLRAAMSAISGKPDAELDALPPEQYAQLAATSILFPDEMEESELGGIPRGWSASPFGSLLTHTIGGDWGSDSPDSSNDTRVAIIRGTDIPDLDQAQFLRVPIRYTTQKKLASRQLQVGDIVLEVSGGSKDQPTGRSIRITANTMREFDCPIEPASFCRLLRPVCPETGVILGLHLTHIYVQGKTWEYQNQSTGIANFQTAHFLEAELVVIPPAEVAEKFYALVNPLLERRHDAQSSRLALLRDTLLPKLLSGELSVTEAMAEAEA